ncbi:alpha/beta fold hydrolase [Agromyces subbeticus]|uniref:alpha/beta fold hydrolase n=1 Tax=Agromyces subbeticus TaxID=293890 RepID=UPI0003B307C2|nr:alpha/beta fold hydrolase [Agromyces subbeticus]
MTTVVLHGLGADRRQPIDLFTPAVHAAIGAGELIIAPDIRAHGGYLSVGEPDDFRLDRLADDVATSVRESIADTGGDASAPLTVIGISLGAAIALRLALDELLPIEHAVFVRPSFSDQSLPDNLRAFPVIGQILADAGPAGVEEFRERAVFQRVAAVSPAGGRGLLTQFAAPDAARRAMRLVEIPRNRAFTADAELAGLAGRGVRSLVIGARRDPVHPYELAERWAAGLDAPLVELPPRDDGLNVQTALLREGVARWLQHTRA